MYDYFEAFSIIPYRLATNGQFATTWTKKTPMHKRTVNFLAITQLKKRGKLLKSCREVGYRRALTYIAIRLA